MTQASHATSPEGFDAEWREIDVSTVDGDLIKRCELFDESDLDSALARFDELSQTPRRLENAASRVEEGFNAHFATRDWAAMAELLADDTCYDDRRRVVNAGTRLGRDTEIANLRALVDIGARTVTSVVIATRGSASRLVVFSGSDQRPRGLLRRSARHHRDRHRQPDHGARRFDLDDIDAAFEELETRYLAGEAAAHASTWAVVANAHAALSRHELPPTTPNWVNIDHRPVTAIAAGEITANIRSVWDVTPDFRYGIETVHRLSNVGAVFTHVAHGASPDGFEAEWRGISILTVEGDLISRCELFDETDLDAALARFEELNRQTRNWKMRQAK